MTAPFILSFRPGTPLPPHVRRAMKLLDAGAAALERNRPHFDALARDFEARQALPDVEVVEPAPAIEVHLNLTLILAAPEA